MEGCSQNCDHVEACDIRDDCAHLIDPAPDQEGEFFSMTMAGEIGVSGAEPDTTVDSPTFVHSLDASAIAVVLREMGMYTHFTETIQRSPLKTVTTINNFSSFLLFVNQSLVWVIDVSKLVDEVDKLIEHVISKGYMQVGRFCKHLSTVR